jgi:hypothetical protein
MGEGQGEAGEEIGVLRVSRACRECYLTRNQNPAAAETGLIQGDLRYA